MTVAHPFMRSFNDEQLTRTKEDLASMVRFVAAAAIVDDPTVLTEFLDWLRSLLIARDVPPAVILAGLEALISPTTTTSRRTAPVITDADLAAGELARDAADEFCG